MWNIIIEPLLDRMNRMTDATGFADDTTAVSVGPDPAICRDMVQEAVDLAIRWGEDWSDI